MNTATGVLDMDMLFKQEKPASLLLLKTGELKPSLYPKHLILTCFYTIQSDRIYVSCTESLSLIQRASE